MAAASLLRKQLHLTQQDMAMLLGITRVHYAMFESGRRSLPGPAMQRYAELQSGLASDTAKKISSPIDPQVIKDHLSRLLKENQYQREKVARQIASLGKKQVKAQSLSKLSELLRSENKSEKSPALPYLPVAGNAMQSKNPDIENLVMQLQIKLELLEVERDFVQSKLETME